MVTDSTINEHSMVSDSTNNGNSMASDSTIHHNSMMSDSTTNGNSMDVIMSSRQGSRWITAFIAALIAHRVSGDQPSVLPHHTDGRRLFLRRLPLSGAGSRSAGFQRIIIPAIV